MKTIQITIRPIIDPMALYELREKYRLSLNRNSFENVYFTFMDQIDFMIKRLTKYIDIIIKIFNNRIWRREALEDVGQKILEKAHDIASNGYLSQNWDSRSNLTKKLYELRTGIAEPEGLTVGGEYGGMLIKSLKIGDNLNIFEVKPDLGYVIVGTSFKYAKLLEYGGNRTSKHHMGFIGYGLEDIDNLVPRKWLIDALEKRYGADNVGSRLKELKNLIKDAVSSGANIPDRPFMKPAIVYVKETNEAINILAEIFAYQFNREIASFPYKMGHFKEIRINVINE